ncbi:MAG: dihydroneopterin aldolase [Bacteroidaceae bacterium]|nr:dihydroneopterin aldolase [Bacteroidaceae bacterium]
MKVQASQVLLKDIRIFAYHGVLPQEHAVGAYFIINLTIDVDFSQAMESDALTGTISYADAYEVIKAEMRVPSKLLEHVGGRICQALLDHFPAATAIHLELLKENPPMGADCPACGIRLSVTR